MSWRAAVGAALCAGLFASGSAASGPDDVGGLPAGPGQDEVSAYCIPCHSLAIVTQQRLSRRVWDEVLDWMVEEQAMPELDPADRALILDYLAIHYAPDTPR